MKRVIPLMMLLAAAAANNALADSPIASDGTISFNISAISSGLGGVSPEGGGMGPYQYTFGSASAGAGGILPMIQNGTTVGFCVDLVTSIDFSTYTANEYKLGTTGVNHIPGGTDFLGTHANIAALDAAQTALEKLVGYYLTLSNANGLPPLMNDPHAGGLQLAIWDVVNPAAGLQSTGNATANSYRDTLLGGYSSYSGALPDVYAIVPTTGQQIQGIVFANANPNVTTPEPAGMVAIAGLGFCGLPFGFVAWRRRKMA